MIWCQYAVQLSYKQCNEYGIDDDSSPAELVHGSAQLCERRACRRQDYLFRYKAAVEAVEPADVLAAARRRLHPAGQVVVVAADAALAGPQLERAGWDVVPLPLEEPA